MLTHSVFLVLWVESCSKFERSMSQGKRNREVESVQLSQLGMEQILSEVRSLHEYLEKEAERAFPRIICCSGEII